MRSQLPSHRVKTILNATADPVKLDAIPIHEFLGFFTL